MATNTKKVTANNNNKFYTLIDWTFTPDAPSFSAVSASNSKTSITINATVTAPATGTFAISKIRGGRTDTYTSYSGNSVNNVRENVAGSVNTRTKCRVYFNNKSVADDKRTSWTNVAHSFTGIATGASKTVNVAITYSDSSTCNGKYFSTTYNLATTQSIGYSMDNTNFQSSPTFTGLTPNTTYTFYIRSRAISFTEDTSDYVYTTVTGRTLGAKVWVKVNGSWVLGTCYVKKNGSWVVANDVDVKSGGTWKPGIN